MIELFYDDIVIKKRKLLSSGKIVFYNTGLVILNGKNGCGKTLLLKNIFSNKKNSSYNIIMVDQNNDAILNRKNVVENITMSKDINEQEQIVNEIKKMGFSYLLDHPIKKLSGGERRIIALLRAFFAKEEILLIDEPTNDLDIHIVKKVLDLFKIASKDKLIIVISHDDRINKLTSNRMLLENSELKNVNFCHSKTENIYKSSKGFSKDRRILSSNLKFNIVSIYLIILLLIISALEVISMKEKIDSKKPDTIRDNQFELYKPAAVSSSGKTFTECFYYSSIDLLYEENLIKKMEQTTELLNQKNESKTVTEYNLDKLKTNDSYTIYPYEYFDTINRVSYFVVDYYLQKYHSTDWENTKLNTSSLFDKPYEVLCSTNDEVVVDRDLYFECVNELNEMSISGKNLEICCSVIVFSNQCDLALFNDNVSKIGVDLSKDTMIRNNDIKDCIYEVNKFISIIDGIKNVFLTFILVFIIEVFFLILIFKNLKREISVFKNYGFEKEMVNSRFRIKMNNRIPKVLLFLIFVGFNIWIFKDIDFLISDYIFSILLFLLFPFSYWVNNKIIDKFFNRYYRWDYR